MIELDSFFPVVVFASCWEAINVGVHDHRVSDFFILQLSKLFRIEMVFKSHLNIIFYFYFVNIHFYIYFFMFSSYCWWLVVFHVALQHSLSSSFYLRLFGVYTWIFNSPDWSVFSLIFSIFTKFSYPLNWDTYYCPVQLINNILFISDLPTTHHLLFSSSLVSSFFTVLLHRPLCRWPQLVLTSRRNIFAMVSIFDVLKIILELSQFSFFSVFFDYFLHFRKFC